MKVHILSIAMASLLVSACSDDPEATDTTAIEPAVQDTAAQEAFEVCDEAGNRYASDADAEAAGLDPAQYGATYCPEYLAAAVGMHPSWDKDGDGLNDCEKDGICDDSVDYSQPRP